MSLLHTIAAHLQEQGYLLAYPPTKYKILLVNRLDQTNIVLRMQDPTTIYANINFWRPNQTRGSASRTIDLNDPESLTQLDQFLLKR